MSKVLVTGGGGFVGKALSLSLLAQGHEVWSVSRGSYPELEHAGIRTLRADLSGPTKSFAEAFRGAQVVFHTAAKVEMWGCYEDFFRVNVIGTRNVINLCREEGVPALVYTSSPSVIADGTDLMGINEDYPYPRKYKAHYPRTKALAEQEVLASSSETLWTAALRPHLIWGRGDTNLVPTILERARSGRLLQIGSGKNKTDITYIDDCVLAHELAWQALCENEESRGKAYFISQGEPVYLWEWVGELLRRHGLAPLSRSIPYLPASVIATCLEALARFRPGCPEPLLTRFLVSEMATSHYFDISRARALLGYQPQFSVARAMDTAFSECDNTGCN